MNYLCHSLELSCAGCNHPATHTHTHTHTYTDTRTHGHVHAPAPVPGDCLVTEGGGDSGLPGMLADPPMHQIRKCFLRGKLKFIKGARTWRAITGTQTFSWP